MIQSVRSWVVNGAGLFLIAFLLIELTVAGAVKAQPSAVKSRSANRVDELFRNNCARCHGADGRAQTPSGELYKTPNLTDAEWWRENSKITSTRSLVGIVSRGKGGMPAFGKKLKPNEITALVNYVRHFRIGQ
jgi:mono/diheme cytochrome c family protein